RIVGRWKATHEVSGMSCETEYILSASGMVEMKTNAVVNGVPRHIRRTGQWKIRNRRLKCYFTERTWLAGPDVDSPIILLNDNELRTQQRDSVATMYRQDLDQPRAAPTNQE